MGYEGIVSTEYDQNMLSAYMMFSNGKQKDEKALSVCLRLLPKLRTPAYLRNCKEKGNEYCNSPATAKMT